MYKHHALFDGGVGHEGGCGADTTMALPVAQSCKCPLWLIRHVVAQFMLGAVADNVAQPNDDATMFKYPWV